MYSGGKRDNAWNRHFYNTTIEKIANILFLIYSVRNLFQYIYIHISIYIFVPVFVLNQLFSLNLDIVPFLPRYRYIPLIYNVSKTVGVFCYGCFFDKNIFVILGKFNSNYFTLIVLNTILSICWRQILIIYFNIGLATSYFTGIIVLLILLIDFKKITQLLKEIKCWDTTFLWKFTSFLRNINFELKVWPVVFHLYSSSWA